jgi:Mlc titration factor MtfA (ptsG expression regulator)
MPFTHRGRMHEALEHPFPQEWRDVLADRMAHWQMLNADERQRLEDLIRIILVDKGWEATQGFTLTDEIRVVIAAGAGLLILGLDYDYYHEVTSIIVSPTTDVVTGNRPIGDGLWTDQPEQVIGEAEDNGPVLIAWDAAKEQALDPSGGRNVVYHEFAHKLDQLDVLDGAPPLDSPEQGQRWEKVCNAEYTLLQEGRGGDLLDPYGATNPGEFFAVVTEVFFNKPIEMQQQKPELYQVLRDFYHQDPAHRETWMGKPS